MNALLDRFTPNPDDITARVMDGELVIIRLSDGTYYSMDNVGVRVWELIEAGHHLPAVVDHIAVSYGVPVERVESDVQAVVGVLMEEQLIVPSPGGAVKQTLASSSGAASVYQAPRLHIYRDMGNLLALDPPTPGIDDLHWGRKSD